MVSLELIEGVIMECDCASLHRFLFSFIKIKKI